MKTTLLTICLFISCIFYAQNSGIKPGDQAMFTACLTEEDPYFCTNETFKNIISARITPQIVEEIKNSPYKDGLDLSILFISDEQGKVIKEEIEVYCENRNLQATIKYLISRLPAFHPKSEKHAIRKSAHVYNLTLIPSSGYESYFIAPRLTKKRIGYDRFASYKKCNGDIPEAQRCFQNTIAEVLLKNVDLPESYVTYTDRLELYFLVNTDGSFILVDLIGGTEELAIETQKIKNSMKRAFTKIPYAQPALIKGIPVIQDFRIPIRTRMTVKN